MLTLFGGLCYVAFINPIVVIVDVLVVAVDVQRQRLAIFIGPN
jgi:hypothetical protein